MFWTIAIPPSAVAYDLAAGTASYKLTNFAIKDWINFEQSLAQLTSFPATVSFDMKWVQPDKRYHVDNATQKFVYDFLFTKSTIEWSAQQDNFKFVSDPADPSLSLFASVGSERNGVFYDKPYAAPAPTTSTTAAPRVGANGSKRQPLAVTGPLDRRAAMVGAGALAASVLLRRLRSVEAERLDDL